MASDEFAIELAAPRTKFARLCADPIRFGVACFVLLAVIPLALFAAVARFEGTGSLPRVTEESAEDVDEPAVDEPVVDEPVIDVDRGMWEDYIFLAYFLTVPLICIAVRENVAGLSRTINRLLPTVHFDDSSNEVDGESGSELTRDEWRTMLRSAKQVIDGMIFRRDPHEDVLPTTATVRRHATWVFVGTFLGGLVFLVLSTRAHWNPLAVYGFRIWSSPFAFPAGRGPFTNAGAIGFALRFTYEAVFYLVICPMGARRLAGSVFLLHHILALLRRTRGVRFLKFATDHVNGLTSLGQQSFANVRCPLPLAIVFIVYVWTYPVTPALILGGILLIGLTVPIAFFAPLIVARGLMRELRDAELDRLGAIFESRYASYKREYETLSPEDRVAATDEQANLEAVYSSVLDQPIWPVGRKTYAKVISIVAALATLLLSQLSKFLG